MNRYTKLLSEVSSHEIAEARDQYYRALSVVRHAEDTLRLAIHERGLEELGVTLGEPVDIPGKALVVSGAAFSKDHLTLYATLSEAVSGTPAQWPMPVLGDYEG